MADFPYGFSAGPDALYSRGCIPQLLGDGDQVRMICHLQTLKWLVWLVRCVIYRAGLGYKCNIPALGPFNCILNIHANDIIQAYDYHVLNNKGSPFR